MPPPRDSLLTWIADSQGLGTVDPVTGTAEALVAAGDLGLVRDDSLRSEVTAYLGAVRRSTHTQRTAIEWWVEGRGRAFRRVPIRDYVPFLVGSSEERAALDEGETFPASSSPERRPFAFDADAFLADPDVFAALEQLAISRAEMAKGRDRLREAGDALLRRVED